MTDEPEDTSTPLDGIIDSPPVAVLYGVTDPTEAKVSTRKYDSQILGVRIFQPVCYDDVRGKTMEIWRADNNTIPLHALPIPKMGYVSVTYPGVRRGPHEHAAQTDMFFFVDGQDFELHLWDNRLDAKMSKIRSHEVIRLCENTVVIIPPGVVHGYRNVGDSPALALNFPDALYRGEGKSKEPDEIRHELISSTIFKF